MRDAMVHAKLGVQDLRDGIAVTETRLTAERAEDVKKYLTGKDCCHDYVDILREFPDLHFTPEDFVKLLRTRKER